MIFRSGVRTVVTLVEQKCLNPNNQKTLSGSPKSKCFLGKRKSKGVDGCFRYKAETELNVLCSDVVEARGIEPLSEDRITGFSPSAGRILDFPCPSACERAMGLGSFILPASPQSLGGPVPHINDAACQSRERFGATRSH